ncbi:MAG: dioxygenase [Candidatus Carbobacillus altaicus]|nr:dioxygenase [Candidatus Carbobacillus altaicus]
MAMPSLFVAHGSPMLAVEDDAYTAFLQNLGQELVARFRPRAIVLFTAHWTTRRPTISAVDGTYAMIYDFYGFPEALYHIVYPARGLPSLAETVLTRFRAAGFEAATDDQRGLDHGSWVVLRRMFPSAEIPVVQASVVPWFSPEQLYRMGKALRPLRDEGVLLIGSGGTVHNLMSLRWESGDAAEGWAVAFDDWLLARTAARDHAELFDYRKTAPHAMQAVPTPEHLAPYWIAFGAGDASEEEEESRISRFAPSGGTVHALPETVKRSTERAAADALGGTRQGNQVLFRAYQYGSLSLMTLTFGDAASGGMAAMG